MKELFEKYSLIGFIIKIIGLVVIVWGIVQGLVISVQFSQPYMDGGEMMTPVVQFGFWGFLSIVFTHAIYGVLIIGFGEVIDLLQKIYDQKSPKSVPTATTGSVSPIPWSSEQDIKAFYAKMNMTISSISPTKNRDVFVVNIDGRTEHIALGGLSPRLLSEEEAERYL
jgi:hypothetical protein